MARRALMAIAVIAMAAAIAGVLLQAAPVAGAPRYPAKPVPPRLMNDTASMLTSSERESIESRLLALNQATGAQFTVVTVPSLGGVSADEFAVTLFEKWGIGESGKDNGLLLLIAEEEHELKFETGYGLEGDLPDSYLGRVVDEALVPNFRDGNPANGILEAADRITARLSGAEQLSASDSESTPIHKSTMSPDEAAGMVFAVIILGLIVLSSIFRGPRGPRGTRRGPFIPPPPGGFGGFGGGLPKGFSGKSSGGFGGFGGGKSGGGGAGGKW